MINLIFILFLYSAIFIIAELLCRKGIDGAITRKIVHIGGSLVSFLLPLFLDLFTSVLIGVFFVIIIALAKRRKVFKSLNEIDDRNYGSVFFPLSLIICGLLFWNINIHIFQGAVLVLGLSDGLAGLIGSRYGFKKYKIIGEKTYLGSFLFFVITFFIFLFIVSISEMLFSFYLLILLILGAILITGVESVFSRGWDNVFVPLASGLILMLIL